MDENVSATVRAAGGIAATTNNKSLSINEKSEEEI
jgi:hypothetical protein